MKAKKSKRSNKSALGQSDARFDDLDNHDPSYYGAAIGGLIGTCVAGPVGTFIGAASGAAWGKAAQVMVKRWKQRE